MKSSETGERIAREFRYRLAALGRAWFVLARDEQKALLLVFALFLLGLAARAWLRF